VAYGVGSTGICNELIPCGLGLLQPAITISDYPVVVIGVFGYMAKLKV
jgi:hypothetical protein